MTFNLEATTALLARTPATLNSLLRDLPDSWTRANEDTHATKPTWSPFDVVGHLIHGELTDWIPRARMILDHGESRAFDRFDRFAHNQASHGQSLPALLDEFARLRAQSLQSLAALNLQPQDFARRGLHPELGTVTLAQLLATWAAHDLTHLHQISRVMAHQYREAVGPWSAYLGVLHCDAHSA